MKTNRFLLSVALAIAGYCAMAADMTLADARRLALASSKTLASLNLSVKGATLDERSQLYESLPSLSLSTSLSAQGGNGSSVSDTAAVSVSAGVSQTVFDGGKNAVLSAIDSLATESARAAARAGYFDVLDSIDSAWYSLQEAYASRDSAESSLKAANVSLEIAQTRLETGAISMTDFLEAEATAAGAEKTLSQAKRDVSVYSLKVASLTGLSTLPAVEQSDFSAYDGIVARLANYSDAEVDSLVAALLASAQSNNPDLAAARAARDSSAKSVSLAKVGYLPTVSASASTGTGYSFTDGSTDPTVSVSLSASLSLDAWKTATSVSSARVALQQSELSLSESARAIDVDLITAVYDLVNESRAVASSAKAYEYAEKSYENNLELYKLGSASVSDLTDAEELSATNRNSLISARYSFLNGLSAIRSLCAFESDGALLALVP